MAKSLQERSSALFDHNLKTQMLQFEVSLVSGVASVEDNVAAAERTDANTIEVEIDQADLAADVRRIKSVELLSESLAGAISVSSALSAGKIVITLVSDADISAATGEAELRVTYKLK